MAFEYTSLYFISTCCLTREMWFFAHHLYSGSEGHNKSAYELTYNDATNDSRKSNPQKHQICGDICPLHWACYSWPDFHLCIAIQICGVHYSMDCDAHLLLARQTTLYNCSEKHGWPSSTQQQDLSHVHTVNLIPHICCFIVHPDFRNN